MGGLLTKCKRRQDQTQDSFDDRPWRRRPPSVVKMNAKDKRKARKSPVRPKKILKPSSTSDLEPTTAEDDFPAMKDWYLSLGFESIVDSAGATEEELAMHCPANLLRHLTLFHRMAKMASRDILERRATLAEPPHRLLVELGHISQLQPELEEWQPLGNATLIAKSLRDVGNPRPDLADLQRVEDGRGVLLIDRARMAGSNGDHCGREDVHRHAGRRPQGVAKAAGLPLGPRISLEQEHQALHQREGHRLAGNSEAGGQIIGMVADISPYQTLR